MNIIERINKMLELNFELSNGYLRLDKQLPAYCLGNLLEWTGKYLTSTSNIHTKEILIENLTMNEISYGFIPRNIHICMSDPETNKENRWYFLNYVLPLAKYARVDVSHSQLAFLIAGLLSNYLYILRFPVHSSVNTNGKYLLKKIVQNIVNNNWKIINPCTNKPTKQGNFTFVANTGLKTYMIYEISKLLGINSRLSLLQKFLLKNNFRIMRRIPLSVLKLTGKENNKNTVFFLHMINKFLLKKGLTRKLKIYSDRLLAEMNKTLEADIAKDQFDLTNLEKYVEYLLFDTIRGTGTQE